MAAILYLGTEKGLMTLKSNDGKSWNVAHHSLKNWEVPKVAVDPAAPNRIFAGTRGDGVWFSENFGESWKKLCYGKRGPGKVRSVALDPNDSNTVYAGTEPIDIFVSRDGTRSWTRLDSVWDIPFVATVPYPVATVEPHVREIAVDPKDSKTIYAALQVGYILKTTDGGASWKLLDKELDCDVHTIVIDPVNTNNIFIATGGHDCRQGKTKGKALYMSRDGGEQWAPTGLEFSQEYSVPLVMHPKNPKIIFAGLAHGQPNQWRGRATGAESLIIKTSDGGGRWEKLDGGLSEAAQGFPEAIAFDESDPKTIYAGTRSGELYGSKDEGNSWMRFEVKTPAVTHMRCVHA